MARRIFLPRSYPPTRCSFWEIYLSYSSANGIKIYWSRQFASIVAGSKCTQVSKRSPTSQPASQPINGGSLVCEIESSLFILLRLRIIAFLRTQNRLHSWRHSTHQPSIQPEIHSACLMLLLLSDTTRISSNYTFTRTLLASLPSPRTTTASIHNVSTPPSLLTSLLSSQIFRLSAISTKESLAKTN